MKKSLLLLLCLALVATACGGSAEETVEEPVAMEEVETLEAPATTAAPAQEQSSSAPDGVFKLAIFQDPATQNLFKWYDTDTDAYSLYQMGLLRL